MGSYTPNLGLYKPAVGETGWGALVDANLDILDADRLSPLHITADPVGGGQLILENLTQGANPAKTPALALYKDGTFRWQLGVDTTAGTQGDFAIFRNDAGTPANSADILYITDEQYPKVSILGDRSSPAALSLYNAVADRIAFQISAATSQTADLIRAYKTSTTIGLRVAANGDFQIGGKVYFTDTQGTYTTAPNISSDGTSITLAAAAGSDIKGGTNNAIKLYDGTPTLGLTLSPAGGGGVLFGPTGAYSIVLNGTHLLANAVLDNSAFITANYGVSTKDTYVGYNARTGGTGAAVTFSDVSVERVSSSLLLSYNAKIGSDLGIAVGNSAAATTLGSVTKKMEVFNSAGASLGYVPIYDSIT